MQTTRFELPLILSKDDGSPRMVGFEREFSGITLDAAFEAVLSMYGGELGSETVAERVLHVDCLGQFNVELDWAYLKRRAAQNDKDETEEWLERLSQAAALLVPLEVVSPPRPATTTQLSFLVPLVAALRDAGAVGTEESLLAAYGVHINTEIPALDVTTLLAYLKAFAILQWWLLGPHEVDATRKVSPYIDLYPQAYLKQLLSMSVPTIDGIFADYLEHNASQQSRAGLAAAVG